MGEPFCFRCVPRWLWAAGFVAFCASAWLGSRLHPKPAGPGPAPPQLILVIFHVYDTQGNELQKDALLTGPAPEVPRQPVTGSECQLSGDVGSHRTLIFEYKGEPKEEHVIWRSDADYRNWLQTELPAQLLKLDPGYAKAKWVKISQHIADRVTKGKYDYPVVFRVRR